MPRHLLSPELKQGCVPNAAFFLAQVEAFSTPGRDELNFFGSLTRPEANNTSHTTPETDDNKPEMIVSVRGVIPLSDQPATVVDKLHVRNSVARSVVITRPRNLSGAKRISKAS